MVITGNVQVCKKHLSLGADMVVPEAESIASSTIKETEVSRFRELAYAMQGRGCPSRETKAKTRRPLAIMQLNHTGRQAPKFIGGRVPFLQRPLSASATRVGDSASGEDITRRFIERLSYSLLFERAKAMDEAEIEDVIERFARGAKLAWETGFDGVQVHAAHGCTYIIQYIACPLILGLISLR